MRALFEGGYFSSSEGKRCGYYLRAHSGPKTPKSKPRGDCPKFICHMKEGYVLISKYKIFFKSVEGNF